jgi:hypothetical protein
MVNTPAHTPHINLPNIKVLKNGNKVKSVEKIALTQINLTKFLI